MNKRIASDNIRKHFSQLFVETIEFEAIANDVWCSIGEIIASDLLKRFETDPELIGKLPQFKADMAKMINECPISVEEWNEWRQDNLDEPEDLISLFRDGIWREMFGDEPVPNR